MVQRVNYHNCTKHNCLECKEYESCYGIEENINNKKLAREKRELKEKKKAVKGKVVEE